MLCSELDRNKIVTEIHSVTNKLSQENYLERLKLIIKELQEHTGENLSDLLPKTKQ